MTTRWLKSAITFIEDRQLGKRVELSMGIGRPKLKIPLPKNFNISKTPHIAMIDLVYNFGQWELHFSYRYETAPCEKGEGIIGVDIGEIHPIVSHDGVETRIFMGTEKKPTNRNYTCSCGFKYHRDGVGAMNIRKKYQGCFGIPVVADMGTLPMEMTPPLGFRLKVPVALA